MILGRRMAVLAVPVLAYGLFVGCKSSSTTPSTTPGVSGATSQASQTAVPTSGSTTNAGGPVYDMKLTGGLTAEWKTGDRSTTASCVLADDGFAALGVSGQIDGKPYGLGYDQNQFAAGTFTYPYGSFDALNEAPFIQIATTTDSKVDWTAGSVGLGSGTAVVTGAKGSAVKLTVDLDMTPRMGGTIVHLAGTLECPTT